MRAPAPEDFSSRLRSPAVAARVGVWLGVAFGICFLTGLVSHYAQLPDPPVPFPTRPVWGYRLTQGLHVTSGVAAIPLLLVKLWSVYPRLFERPDLRPARRLAVTVLERGSIAVLVSSAVFQLVTGLLNAAQWYPWTAFSFRTTHYALAWVAVGSLLVHVAVKLPVIRDVLRGDIDDTPHDRATAVAGRPPVASRAAALRAGRLGCGGARHRRQRRAVAALDLGLRGALRRGPGGVPINKSAAAAGVERSATDPGYRLAVVADGREVASLSVADLRALPQHTEELPIACVEGWSASGVWGGIRIADVLAAAGLSADRDVTVVSLQPEGPFRRTTLPANFVADERSLLALDLAGAPLDLDHGFPCRVIAPNRPGVLQTKWVGALEVSST